MSGRAGQLDGLQYIRGFAALAVVVDHVASMGKETKYFHYVSFHDWLNKGACGVDLFFVLSGFIMAFIALKPDLTPKLGLADFSRRRFERIVPFLWFAVFAYTGLKLMGRGHDPFDTGGFVRGLTLWPVGGRPMPDSVWTLRHEFLFYGLFGLFALQFPRLWWLIAVWAASPVLMAALGHPGGEWGDFLFNPVNVLFGTGTVAGVAFLKWRDRLPAISPWWLAVSIAGFLAVAWGHNFKVRDVATMALIGPIGAACVFVGALVKPAETVVGRALKFLGDASYSIYLTHLMFVSAALGFVSHHLPAMPPAVWISAISLGAVAGGCLLSVFVEKPLIAWVKRRLDTPAPILVRKAA